MSLPSGYKQLEYIESSGTQRIDSGVRVPKGANMKIVMDAQFPSQTGVYGGSDWYFQWAPGPDYAIMKGSTTGFPIGNRDIVTIEYKNDIETLYVNGQQAAQQDWSAQNYPNYKIGLFCMFTAKDVWFTSNTQIGKKYSYKIYDNDTLVRDYIPCQTASGEIGMWDDVNSVFYGNDGTGTFTAGPVVGVATPANFRLSSSSETTATLAWDAVDGATGYKLYRDGTLTATLTDTSYTDTIQPFTSYIYTLTAYNNNGESDPATISVQIIIQPETPSNFRVSFASMTVIALEWDAVTGAESYKLSRDGAVIYTGSYPSYTDRGLTSETAYTYTLSAVNTAGNSAETTLEAITMHLILVTDRTAADVAEQNAKGTYNAADLNRVGEAMNYVADRLKEAGYDPHISPKTDWKDDDWVDPAAQAVYLGDLAELRKQFTMLESTPRVPPRILATAINSGDGLTYGWANDIEQILMDIDALLTNIAAGWLYSGEIYSGEV